MEFEQNAAIVSSSGDTLGHIARVVVDHDTNAVTHIIVRKGTLLHEDKVVPIQMVAATTENEITLRADANDLHELPPFEEEHYVQSGDGGGGGTTISQPLSGMPGAFVVEARPKYIKQIEQHIPPGSVALKEGAKVTASDGKRVGHVERVVTDGDASQATHLLVAHGALTKEKRLVPMAWVSVAKENEVYLNVDAPKVEALKAYVG